MILSKYSAKERDLIDYLLKSPKNEKWLDLANKFNIKPNGTDKQRRTKANDIWRKFLKHLAKHDLELETVKQTYRNGELLFETKKRVNHTEEIDTTGFQMESFTTNPNGKAWKKFKKVVDTNSATFIFDKLFEKYRDFELKVRYPNKLEPSNRIGILNLYDAHLDKIPVKSTTGEESSLERNIKIFHNTIERILPVIINNQVEKIILPLGNDLFHTNGMNNKTKKGTELDYFVNPEEAYYAICDAVVEVILRLSTFVKLDILMIKGNHDEDKITTLGYWLEKVFRSSERINVEHTRRQRKYIQYGENLIGFAHGDKEKSKIQQLPLIMAQESKKMWGNTTYRKMYLGDLHHGFEYQFLKAKDMPGVEVEYLRSVGTTDTWHEDFGWIGIPKTAYLQIFDKYEGETTRYKFNIK